MSYVQMNLPAIQAAASGKTPSSSTPDPTPSPMASTRRVFKPSALKIPVSTVDKVSNHDAIKAFLPLAVSPKSVNFGDLVDKQSVQQVVYLTAPTTGIVKAELPSGTPFHIVSIKALDGKLLFTAKDKWTGSLVNTGMLEMPNALAVAKAAALYKDAASQNAQASTRRRVTNPVSASASLKAASLKPVSIFQTEATSAPFEIHAKQYQRIRVVVEFKPHFDLFSGDYVGVHTANLEITADGRSASVPLRAKFDGLNIGVVVIPQDRELTILAAPKFVDGATGNNRLQEQHLIARTTLTIANPGPPCKIIIVPTDLPEGFSHNSEWEQKIPTGQTTAEFSVDMHYWGDTRGAQYAYGYEVPFTITTPQRSWTEVLTVNLLPSMRHSHWHGGLDGVAYDIDVLAYSGGTIEITYAFNTTNAWNTDAEFTYSINGREYGRCGDIRVPTHHDVSLNPQTVKPVLVNPQLSTDWERIINSPASLWLKVSEHP